MITVSRQNTTTDNGLAKEFGHLELKKYFFVEITFCLTCGPCGPGGPSASIP